MSKNYLIHHGIKGQRWGVRRFQNEDGTYTAAGKRRYSSDEESDNALKSRDWGDLYSQIQDKKKNSASLKIKMQKIDSEKEAAYEKQANDYSNIDAVKKYAEARNEYFRLLHDQGRIRKIINPFKRAAQAYANDVAYGKAVYGLNKITDSKEYKEARDKNFKAERAIKDKWINKTASAILKELGYNDTETARKYLDSTQAMYDFD